jgi:hypothetical protein
MVLDGIGSFLYEPVLNCRDKLAQVLTHAVAASAGDEFNAQA